MRRMLKRKENSLLRYSLNYLLICLQRIISIHDCKIKSKQMTMEQITNDLYTNGWKNRGFSNWIFIMEWKWHKILNILNVETRGNKIHQSSNSSSIHINKSWHWSKRQVLLFLMKCNCEFGKDQIHNCISFARFKLSVSFQKNFTIHFSLEFQFVSILPCFCLLLSLVCFHFKRIFYETKKKTEVERIASGQTPIAFHPLDSQAQINLNPLHI